MNTNSNIYTVIYTTLVCVLVAAILAFVSQTLGPKQDANEKAETISQILTAAKFGEKAEWQAKGNAAVIDFYKENIESATVINADGEEIRVLDPAKAEIISTAGLKAENYNIKDADKAADAKLPVYKFKNGVTVLPIYGAGLWGPVWGYIALESDLKTVVGAYFDHESETPGLGGKIKDDPAFRAQFGGKSIDFSDVKPFAIVKGGAPAGKDNAIDAITGATMTSKGVDAAITQWLNAYKPFLTSGQTCCGSCCGECCGEGECCGNCCKEGAEACEACQAAESCEACEACKDAQACESCEGNASCKKCQNNVED